MKRSLEPFQGWRLTFFQAVIVGVFILFGLRMYQLQVVENSDWQFAADGNRLQSLPLPSDRGVIFDRFGRNLAINVPAFNITIVPALLPDGEEEQLTIFNRLSALTGVPPTSEIRIAAGSRIRSIEELVAEGEGIEPFQAVIIAQDVPQIVALQINEERISMPGVAVEPVAVREYPTGSLTAHIVGYMGPIPADEAEALREQGYNPAFDRIGYDGVEFFLEGLLAGQRGEEVFEVDVAGQRLRTISITEPSAGRNVRLTIDTELQAAAEAALAAEIAIVNQEAGYIRTQQGVVIAMDPRNGQILAMVSYPTYDNTRFARAIDFQYYQEVAADPARPLYNGAIRATYPPGSVWKLVTAAAVLDENVIAPETILLDEGDIIVENRYAPNDPAASQRFVCWLPGGHGQVDFIRGIAYSCDVYFYKIGGGFTSIPETILRQGGLGINDLFRHATAMGIGSELGVELPGERAWRMPDPDWKRINFGENWSTGDTYNAAFGQGYVLTTPLQLISSVATIVNNGTLYQPTIIDSFLDPEGGVIQPFAPNVMRTVNIENLTPQDELTLLMVEDMIIKGPDSLTCTCEPDSAYYNPVRCDPVNYRAQVDIIQDPLMEDMRTYRVHVPINYPFNGQVCEPIRFDPNYTPAFSSSYSLGLVREGMRAAVTIEGGTASNADLPYVTTAGKTGTAEYCDDVARPLGLCIPGGWPTHAWYVGYAPYENPEIIIIGFLYNAGEGSQVALPVVVETMEAYFRLKAERENTARASSTP